MAGSRRPEKPSAIGSKIAGVGQETAPDAKSINWERAKALYRRSQAGAKLMPDEQSYLDRAKALCAVQGQPVASPDGSPSAQAGEKPVEKPNPTVRDISYGPHPSQVIDIWKAASREPTPLVVYIHGGGFRAGDKTKIHPALIVGCLNAGISVASIGYRLSPEVHFPDHFLDARAIQFLRATSRSTTSIPPEWPPRAVRREAGLRCGWDSTTTWLIHITPTPFFANPPVWPAWPYCRPRPATTCGPYGSGSAPVRLSTRMRSAFSV